MSWVITGVSKSPLLLDTYSGAAAAYSLRSLSLAYGGSVVRVRRSSDNTEQDFTAAQVTDGTLTTFCGAGNGFVTTWYDQSGNNRDLAQATNANQIRIVNSGVVESDGGKPALRTPSGYLTLSRAWGLAPTNPRLFLVRNITGGVTSNYSGHWVDIGNQGPLNNHTLSGLYNDYFNTARPGYGPDPNSLVLGTRCLETFVYSSGTGTVRINGQSLGSNAFTLITPTNLLVGGSNSDAAGPAIGSIQELVIYNTGTGIDEAAVESNLNAHYSIY
jgi:hypothetical protein